MTPLEQLIEDLEETLFAMGELAPFDFNGYEGPEGEQVRREAYLALTSRFALHPEWRRWPSEDLGRAEEGTEFTFTDADREADVTVPFVILVPDDPEAVADELERQFYPDGRPEKRRWWRRSR